MGQYFSKAGAPSSALGQYRAQIFPVSKVQAETIRRLPCRSNIPMSEPGSAEAAFWPAEAYHQKYRLRRRSALVHTLADILGSRWDEHVFATKLNALGQPGFSLEPWLPEMPSQLVDALDLVD